MKPQIVELEGHKIMVLDNVPLSVYPPPLSGYWCEMVPETEPKDVLILGLGGGTVANLIKTKYPNVKITGVEESREIIALAKREMGLKELKIKIVINDAFDFVALTQDKYDLIIIDLWDGSYFCTVPLSPDFMDDCKKILTKGGKIYLNAPNLDVMAENVGFGEKTEIHTNSIYKYGN